MYNKLDAKCLKTCLISALMTKKRVLSRLQSKLLIGCLDAMYSFLDRQRIDAWIQDPSKTDDKDGVNIETRNAYQRRLIYQEVRKQWVATMKSDSLVLMLLLVILISLLTVEMVLSAWSSWLINSEKSVPKIKCSNSRYLIDSITQVTCYTYRGRVKKDCAGAVGFRRVVDMISASRKPVVGHNMLLDMCHVIAQFIQPLPEDVQDFKKLARKLFPW